MVEKRGKLCNGEICERGLKSERFSKNTEKEWQKKKKSEKVTNRERGREMRRERERG